MRRNSLWIFAVIVVISFCSMDAFAQIHPGQASAPGATWTSWPREAMGSFSPALGSRPDAPKVKRQPGPRPENADPMFIEVNRYATQDDYPTNPVLVNSGSEVSRTNAGIGMTMISITGGGCAIPAPDGSCAAMKMLERWTIEWHDPAGAIAARQWLTYHAWTQDGQQHCWNGNPCLFAPIDGPNPLGWWTTSMPVTCSMGLGVWTTKVQYQYSTDLYGTTWSTPREIFSQAWRLTPREDALSVTLDRVQVNPSVAHTGGTVHPSIPAGTANIIVTATECEPLAGVNFSLEIEPLPATAGHKHLVSGTVLPPLDSVATLASTAGTTGRDGRSDPILLTAGMIASDVKIRATTTSLMPGVVSTFTSPEVTVHVGFSKLRSYVPDPSFVTTTGSRNDTPTEPYLCGDPVRPQRCDNHRDENLYGNPRLIRDANIFAAFYYQEFGQKLRLNDMSLPRGGVFDINGNWSPPEHASHRLGTDVDLSAHVLDSGGNLIIDGLDIKWLTTWIADNLGGTRVREEPVHYRLSPAEIDEVVEEETP